MSHSDSTAQANINDKLNLYLIGYSPDVHYLERLLENVKPIIKSLSFVCTDEKEDCLDVIKASGVPFEFDRMLFPKREDFDFSKARNKALEMAKKNEGWYFWLDCDDLIENPEEILKQMEQQKDSVAFGLPYDVNERSDNLFKIRIHKDEWHWVNPVHEELVPIESSPKKKVIILSDCPVKHAPDENKSNHEFHISLLKKSAKTAEADYTYLAKEYFNSLQNEKAIPYIKKAIAIHSFPHEIYNLWMMLGICYATQEKSEEAKRAWLSGLEVSPYRKEAYYYLAEIYGREGGNDSLLKGLGYISACTAMIDKKEPLQNSNVYNNQSFKLHARYLQKFNKYKEALKILSQTKAWDEECDIIKKELEDACSK